MENREAVPSGKLGVVWLDGLQDVDQFVRQMLVTAGLTLPLAVVGADGPLESLGLDPWWWTRGWWLRRDGQGSGQGGFVGEWGLVTAG